MIIIRCKKCNQYEQRSDNPKHYKDISGIKCVVCNTDKYLVKYQEL